MTTLSRLVTIGITFILSNLATISFAQTFQLDDETIDWIQVSANEVNDKVIAWRRDIHQHPELGRFEIRTAKLVSDHLQSLGIETYTGVAKTGIIGILRGETDGPTIALRADMDALPIREETGLFFASQAMGNYLGEIVPVMHACGHDGHTAMLMGAAEILANNRYKVTGTIVFIFQPAEEGAADIDSFNSNAEKYGAVKIIEEGILDKHGVEAVFGLHVMPQYPIGQYLYKANTIMNSADSFRIKVIGSGTHGSMPWTGTDVIYASAQIVSGVQTIISRRINIMSGTGILSFGSINGGSAVNIIPNEVKLSGTIRTDNPDIRKQILAEFPLLVKNIATAYNTKAEVEIGDSVSVTVNNPSLTKAMIPLLSQINSNILELTMPNAASEDFSAYAEKVPSLFIFLGVSDDNNGKISEASPLHSSTFILDERALKYGVMAHLGFAMNYANIQSNITVFD